GLAKNPGGSTLGGTLTVTAVNGTATFNGLTLDKGGTGYTLQATANGQPPVTTSAFDVASPTATATQLAVTAQPSGPVTAGTGFTLTVSAETSLGAVDPTFHGTVTVALMSNPGGSTLGGTVTVSASGGVATFSGLTLNNPGNGYTLMVSSN